tara:strand:- start:5342 stop:6139 length:798 start_codon:yes stop_codon:yes gene_type:complete
MSPKSLPFFQVHHVGPVLAFNLLKNETTTRGRELFLRILDEELPAHSLIMPVFGEIDCRAHIQVQAEKQGKSVNEIVHHCAMNYIHLLDEIKTKGFNVIAYNVIPSRPYRCRYTVKKTSRYPTYGSQKERNLITSHFNDLLREGCQKRGFPFLENFDLLVDSHGRTDEKFYMDKIHLSRRAMPMTLDRLRDLFPGYDFRLSLPYAAELGDSLCKVSQSANTFRSRVRKYYKWKYNSIKSVLHPKKIRAFISGRNRINYYTNIMEE